MFNHFFKPLLNKFKFEVYLKHSFKPLLRHSPQQRVKQSFNSSIFLEYFSFYSMHWFFIVFYFSLFLAVCYLFFISFHHQILKDFHLIFHRLLTFIILCLFNCSFSVFLFSDKVKLWFFFLINHNLFWNLHCFLLTSFFLLNYALLQKFCHFWSNYNIFLQPHSDLFTYK